MKEMCASAPRCSAPTGRDSIARFQRACLSTLIIPLNWRSFVVAIQNRIKPNKTERKCQGSPYQPGENRNFPEFRFRFPEVQLPKIGAFADFRRFRPRCTRHLQQIRLGARRFYWRQRSSRFSDKKSEFPEKCAGRSRVRRHRVLVT